VSQNIANRIRNASDIDDISQEVFIKVFRALPRFRGDSLFSTWLYRITENTIKTYYAKQARRDMESPIDDMQYDLHPSKAASPDEQLSLAQWHQAVDKALSELPEVLSSCLLLKERQGLSYDKIAQMLNIPVGTVRSRIFRARENINKQVTR